MSNQSTSYDTDNTPEVSLDIPVNVKNVFIDGLARSRNELITNQLQRLFEVKTFEELINQANLCRLKLARIGIFQEIGLQIDVSDTDSADDFDVIYHVREANMKSASIGTEASQTDKNVSFSGKLVNLRGLGETMKMSVSRGTNVKSSYEFSWSKPWVKNTDCLLTLNSVKSVTDYSPSYFKETAHGLGANISLPSPLGVHTLGWNFHWRENTIGAQAPFEIREQCGHSLKSTLRHTFVSDGRNDWVIPSQGHYFKQNIEYSGVGGDIKALRSDVEVQLNKEMFSDVIFSASFRAGAAMSLSESPLWINERYFLGGPMSVRGFAARGIGAHAEQASLGGELFWESGVHLFTPLPFLRNKESLANLFRLHFFANAGNLENFENVSRLRHILAKPRASFGVGIMFNFLNNFRLELNYCVPKNARPSDKLNPGLQVGLGVSFL